MGGGPKTKALATCPRPGHAGSKVKFDGTYGPPAHRRQRYKCTPTNGDPPHRFTEELPREESWTHTCEECERPVPTHRGPQSARHYQFVARGVAGALIAMGHGESYRRAAEVSRTRAKRDRINPATGRPRSSKHGQLVADWVEVFAPVVFERHRPNDWPSAGTLLLDHMPFRTRAVHPTTGALIPGGRVAFDVFAAMGYEDGKARVWRLEAFPNASQANWEAFLGSLGGETPRVVCDNHSGMTQAIRAAWPGTNIYLCEWHLQHAFERLLDAQMKAGHRAVLAPLLPRAKDAFTGLNFWLPYVQECRAAGVPSVDRWLDTTGAVVEAQFRRRGLRSGRPADMPLSSSELESKLRTIRDALHPRRYALKNRERTNRLLMLMQMHANADDRETTYCTDIRRWLEANDGRPRVGRRVVADPAGLPSLR